MDLDQDYIEYVGESSLALLAVSAAYFLDLYNPVSYGVLLMIPVLFGYTTFISREGFNSASLLSLVTLIFVPVNALLGFIAVFIPISNVLISISSGGTGFKNYSNATLLPMIFTGLLLGGVVFGAAQTQPEVKHTLISNIEESTAEQASIIMEQTKLAEIQKDASKQVVRSTSETTILLTRNYVINETDLDRADRVDVSNAFASAQDEIPQRFSQRVGERSESLNLSEKAAEGATNLIEANLGIIILMASLFFYAINPLISILTGVSGVVFEKLAEQL